uniref:Uncharacterized protein LOC104247922 n=1 Tax=Nicotiana sylvestris TaxID=4096 RepID=A0A1U7YT25_NICSY
TAVSPSSAVPHSASDSSSFNPDAAIPSPYSKVSFPCNICPMARQTRLPFPDSSIHSSKPFQIIHVDTWGPYHTYAYSGSKYFLTIVDDFTRSTWTHLMGSKSNAFPLLKAFVAMLKTQLLVTIQCIRDVVFHEQHFPFSSYFSFPVKSDSQLSAVPLPSFPHDCPMPSPSPEVATSPLAPPGPTSTLVPSSPTPPSTSSPPDIDVAVSPSTAVPHSTSDSSSFNPDDTIPAP